MSFMPYSEPDCRKGEKPGVEHTIEARNRDLGGGLSVRRLLPSRARRMVGPFIYFDHMGPTTFATGEGLDVRPYPHIGLSTVTYFFEGQLLHRDGLGSYQTIRPGEINWMTAGRGIVHSERAAPEPRRKGLRLHGIQLWAGLPAESEEVPPEFHHHEAAELPEVAEPGVRIRVLAGSAYGRTSPVRILSPLFCVDAALAAGSALRVPDEYEERAVYVGAGAIRCGDEIVDAGKMLVFSPTASPELHAESETRMVLLGGAPLDGAREIFWNFVSSSKERIERAKQDWREGRFPKIPGDSADFVPLPE